MKINITASDDLKKAYCQVLNVYTLNEQFKDEGMSKINTVNVSCKLKNIISVTYKLNNLVTFSVKKIFNLKLGFLI